MAVACHLPGGPCHISCKAPESPAIMTANSCTLRFHVFLGLPLFRGPSPAERAKDPGRNTQRRTGLSSGRSAMRPKRHTCLYASVVLSLGQQHVCKTAALLTRLYYEWPMPNSMRRHRAWNASSLLHSDTLSHIVWRQYISFATTHASNIATFFCNGKRACFHILHKA